MLGRSCCTARPRIGWSKSIAAMTAALKDCSVLFQSSFQNLLMICKHARYRFLIDRRQSFVSQERIDSGLNVSFLNRFDVLEAAQPCGAGSATCASTTLVRRVYPTEMCQEIPINASDCSMARSFCACRAQFWASQDSRCHA